MPSCGAFVLCVGALAGNSYRDSFREACCSSHRFYIGAPLTPRVGARPVDAAILEDAARLRPTGDFDLLEWFDQAANVDFLHRCGKFRN